MAAGMVPTRSRNIGLILRDRGVQAASLVALVVIWAVFATLIGTFGGTSIVPGPFDVAPRFATLITSGEWVAPLLETLSRTGVGFAVAFVAGIVIGITTAKVPVFRMTTSPLLRVLLFFPTLILIYIGTSMLGVSGGGYTTIALIAGLVVGPNVAIYMRDGMNDFDPDLTAMADSYRVPTRQRVLEVYLPFLVPPMLAASRIAFSQTWKVVMLSEVFGLPGGLGFQIRSAEDIGDPKRMMAYLIVFIVALLVIEQGIRILEHRIVKWKR